MIKLKMELLPSATFPEELNRQCRILLIPASLLAFFAWLPYISLDVVLHPDYPSIIHFRIGLTIVGLIALVCFFIPRLKQYNYWVFFGLMFYLEAATGTILGMVTADPAYMGGFSMILLLIPLIPFKRTHALLLVVVPFFAFLIVGYLNGLSFHLAAKRYALLNIAFALLASGATSYLLDYIRRSAFNNAQLLKKQNRQIEKQNRDLQEAFEKINTLSGLLPICSGCKSIRDEKGYWHTLETYIAEHSDASFSHSLCSDCLKRLYPELAAKMEAAEGFD